MLSCQMIFFILYLVLAIYLFKKKNLSLFKHILVFLFAIYIITVFSVTMFPLPIQSSLIREIIKYHLYGENNIIPFKDILFMISYDDLHTIIKQIDGNILLLTPFGFLLPLIFNSCSFGRTLLFGFLFSVLIECSRFVMSLIIGYSYRTTDIDDVILNTIGVCLGHLILFVLSKSFKFKTIRVFQGKA